MNLLFAIVAIADLVVGPGEAKLSWTDPNCDSASFTVYYGPSPGNYTTTLSIEPIFADGKYWFLVEDLNEGTWYFVGTVTDMDGDESEYSNEASKVIGTPCTDCHGIGTGELE